MAFFISAKAPANSTPVGPAPTNTKFINKRFSLSSRCKTACSKFSKIKLRIFNDCGIVFIDMALRSISLFPK